MHNSLERRIFISNLFMELDNPKLMLNCMHMQHMQTLALFLAQRGLSDDDGCLDDGRLNDLD